MAVVAVAQRTITDLSDAYTVVLSNEAHVVSCDAGGNPLSGELGISGKATCDISVLCGGKSLSPVGEAVTPVPGQFKYVLGTPVGCTVARTDNDTFYLASLTADSGYVPVTIYIEGTGTAATKRMSFAKAKTGATGATGSAGTPGTPGAAGAAGADGYAVVLSNESRILAAASSGAISGTQVFTTTITVYRGAQVISNTMANPSVPSGATVTVNTITNNIRTLSISFPDGVGLTGDAGSIDLAIVADGKTFTRTLSWCKSKAGAAGAPGAAGVSAKLITLTPSGQVFKKIASIVTPATLSICAVVQNTTITAWTYSTDGANFTATAPAGVSRSGNTVTITGAAMTDQMISIHAADATVSDTVTIIKVEDGPVVQGLNPPSPVPNLIWINTSSTPAELLRWRGLALSPSRFIDQTKSGSTVTIDNSDGIIASNINITLSVNGTVVHTSSDPDAGSATYTLMANTEVPIKPLPGVNTLQASSGTLSTDYIVSGWEVINDLSDVLGEIRDDVAQAVAFSVTEIDEAKRQIKSEVAATYATKLNLSETSAVIQSSISQQTDDKFQWITSRKTLIQSLDSNTPSIISQVQNCMEYNGATGVLTLRSSNSGVKLQLSNGRISFIENENEVAYISNSVLNIENAQLNKTLKVGNFAWQVESTDNNSFSLIGG